MDRNTIMESGFANIALIEELYDRFKKNPADVDPSWRKQFESFDRQSPRIDGRTTTPEAFSTVSKQLPTSQKTTATIEQPADLRVYRLIEAYRTYGHLMAKTNPLAEKDPEEPWQLNLNNLGFSERDLDKSFPTCSLIPEATEAPLKNILETLKTIYCGKVGVEYMGLMRPDLEKWLQERIEPKGFEVQLNIEQKKMILKHLNKSELFESFLHMKYPGQKRFSLEGGETLIPMMEAVIDKGAESGIVEFVLGMAHRGRLNVLSNIMNKSYSDIFSEFDEGYIPETFDRSGDVKYHKGYFSQTLTPLGHKVKVHLTPNPSHLEAVDPVVEGQVYAKQVILKDVDKKKVMPILVHGDAALAGQGVVYETLQMYNLEGYGTGGTVHLVINNQIGFTTLPSDARSTYYCTDIARAFGAPVFHVNAEDPEGCVNAAYLAAEIRQKFHCDVFLDMICYRKYGHNETDEPAFTQPHEYKHIRQKKPIREIFRDHLIQQGVLERQVAEELETEFKNALQASLKDVKNFNKQIPTKPDQSAAENEAIFRHVQTGVAVHTLREIVAQASKIPEGFKIHPKLNQLIKDHLEMAQESENAKPIDWGMAEMLAFGTLLWQGTPVRLSGQDSCRGTFSHRHAMWMDQAQERPYYPLQHLKEGQARFDVFNSLLSEFAVLGFEYGYSLAYPESLVLWEAQFGDFGNSAQVIIDQFLTTGEQKWNQNVGVTLLLPHGYEGQGPEHSSARIERFLTLSGHKNIQVTYPSTPAQFFHLLRRQALRSPKKPLVVFTPKGLLRHPQCVSKLEELTMGSFQEILDDPQPPKKTKRLVLCTGRIYYDLISERAKNQTEDLAIVRIEQLYPFYTEKMKELFDKYSGFKTCYWVQEEPKNMGAGEYMLNRLQEIIPKDVELKYISRPRSASPAVGSHAMHKQEYQEIIAELFGRKQPSIFDIASKFKK